MKNLLFTIIALVAFSTFSFANTTTKDLKKNLLTVNMLSTENKQTKSCCTKIAKLGNGVTVTVTACVSGNQEIHMSIACMRAEDTLRECITLLNTLAL